MANPGLKLHLRYSILVLTTLLALGLFAWPRSREKLIQLWSFSRILPLPEAQLPPGFLVFDHRSLWERHSRVTLQTHDGRLVWRAPSSNTSRVPSWSPDGSKVAFEWRVDETPYLAWVDLTQDPPRLITTTTRLHYPRFAPDGKSVTGFAPGDRHPGMALWRVFLEPEGISQTKLLLSETAADLHDPQLLLSGEFLTFTRSEPDRQTVIVAPVSREGTVKDDVWDYQPGDVAHSSRGDAGSPYELVFRSRVAPGVHSQLIVHNWLTNETRLKVDFRRSVRHPSFAGPQMGWILAHLVEPHRFSRPVAVSLRRNGAAFRIPGLPLGSIQNIEWSPTAGQLVLRPNEQVLQHR